MFEPFEPKTYVMSVGVCVFTVYTTLLQTTQQPSNRKGQRNKIVDLIKQLRDDDDEGNNNNNAVSHPILQNQPNRSPFWPLNGAHYAYVCA